jgi:hypothetical protein
MKNGWVLLAAAALLVAGCSREVDSDALAHARRNLKPAPCGASPAIAGVASIHGDPRQTYLGDWVVMSICHMRTLMEQAEAEQQPVTLFIEGVDSGLEPTGLDYDEGVATFVLDRNEKNTAVWKPLLYNPLFDSTVTVRLSAGIHGDRPLPKAHSANATVILNKIYLNWVTFLWFGVLALIVAALVTWARGSDMLRDGHAINGVRQPYSLARSQMAWWLFLILVGYNYIWLVTGDRDTIAPSLLALMGISAVTAIAAEAIPTRNRTNVATRGFWHDLVTDEHEAVALDRFQIVAWTIVLGGIFLYSVLWDLTMPEFNTTMLALMGISSGTYLGFKLPTKADEPPKTTGAPAG